MTLFSDGSRSDKFQKAAPAQGIISRLFARFGNAKVDEKSLQRGQDRSDGFAVSFDYVMPNLIEKRHIFVVEGRMPTLFSMVSKVAVPALSIESVGSFGAAKRAIIEPESAESLLVLDIDTLGSVAQSIEELIELRRISPETPVVIGSASFARHDFSMVRSVIADASVRLPCDCVSVALAIESAVGNNKLRFQAA
ncbi:hypothetical protein [Roseinatronobacter bogoriensis]|uniref:Response regulatory domain-containing protein n=1 Tax=Roseinatronobacter bogoriensis subsp. barguzinensis TaxID=441209 RepID=A0A2K8K540_9RHOB|nr:hypothetical protein [Rhodobaca]ATX64539.1 hypothetical protein BG454_00750 [Rhodobaca barguzinensis]MBB4209716.1 hypothetical protein [Rhodobaca bogoriensis DSM 18756]TDW33732.1 hypothetical protein LY39_03565 [Rhodobaca barguzinensis]TDY66203.1 hypothetical protein EV660_11356 [Rhodobaca bogoriensis DSM 18756]